MEGLLRTPSRCARASDSPQGLRWVPGSPGSRRTGTRRWLSGAAGAAHCLTNSPDDAKRGCVQSSNATGFL
ncbi:hypothetical protein GTY87_29900 [Streptomyces sp. SID7813]|nr:hypothetical protein [Streptomyces sp. SID7813]QFI45692.1 hypothetical protein FQ762_30195 [Streptomyces coelicolor A3(2)]THA99924.1 hypothetical protein E6R61_01265 [Streptomyces sp. LRa12]